MNIYKNGATAITLFMASQLATAAPFGLEARSLAMGNASVATSDIATAAFANPAMLSFQKFDDDFALLLPAVGAFLDDSDGMVDLIDSFQAQNDIYDAAVAAGDAAGAAAAATRMFAIVQNLNGKTISPQVAGAIAIGFSGEQYSFAISARTDIALSGRVLSLATNPGDVVDPALTQLTLLGVQTTELGVSIARSFDLSGRKLSIGITPKTVDVKALAIIEPLSTVGTDLSDLTDENNSADLGSFSTMDAGLAFELSRNIQVGVLVRNVITEDFEINGIPVNIDTQTRAGIAYRSNFFTLGADIDVTENDPATPLGNKSQMVSLGAEFNASNFAQLRIGVQKNIASGIPDNAKNELITAGVGFWLGFNLDIAVVSSDDVLGAFVQTGFRF